MCKLKVIQSNSTSKRKKCFCCVHTFIHLYGYALKRQADPLETGVSVMGTSSGEASVIRPRLLTGSGDPGVRNNSLFLWFQDLQWLFLVLFSSPGGQNSNTGEKKCRNSMFYYGSLIACIVSIHFQFIYYIIWFIKGREELKKFPLKKKLVSHWRSGSEQQQPLCVCPKKK